MKVKMRKSDFASLVMAVIFGLGLASVGLGQVSGFDLQEDAELQLKGEFQLEDGTQAGYLVLTAKIPTGSYIYSLTQPEGPPPSKIEIAKTENFKVFGKFQPDTEPTVVENDPVFGGRIEKHKKSLRFFIPIQLSDGVPPNELTVKLRFNGQICSDEGTCRPIRDKIIDAGFTGYFPRVAKESSGQGSIRK